jgi:hypothetical protein
VQTDKGTVTGRAKRAEGKVPRWRRRFAGLVNCRLVVTHHPNIGQALPGKFKDFPAETDSSRFHWTESALSRPDAHLGFQCQVGAAIFHARKKNTQSPAHGILL